MIGKTFRGLLVLVVWGILIVGIAALLPDQAWKSFPRKLHPIRTFLAQKKIISAEFLPTNDVSPVSNLGEVQEPESASFASKEELPPLKLFQNPSAEPEKETGFARSGEKKIEPSPKKNMDTLPTLQYEPIATLPLPEPVKEIVAENRESKVAIPEPPVRAPESLPPPFPSVPSNLALSSPSVNSPPPQTPIEVASIPDPGPIAATSATLPMYPQSKTSIPDSLGAASSEQLTNSLQQSLNEYQLLNERSSSEELRLCFDKLNQILHDQEGQLSEPDRRSLESALDKMAFLIFYDRNRHVLESPYLVGGNETLRSIANQYQVTPEFLAAVNGLSLSTDQPLPPGLRLKVVRGPVTAKISMVRKELLLLFNGRYAGRFRMGCAENARALRGTLSITKKLANPLYRGPIENGPVGEIPGGDPRNPLGPFWLELNNGLGLQGTNHPEYIGRDNIPLGGLIFSNQDIVHLNILLPEGATLSLKD